MAGDETYEEYERKCTEERKKNEGYLDEFEEWLRASKLTDKTINRHLGNVEFFLNDFLLYSDALPMEEGARRLDEFLGDFFVRKCMWSSPTQVRQNAASLKKFYKCMQEKGRITKDDLSYLMDTVKENMDVWVAGADDYGSGSGIFSGSSLTGYDDPLGFLTDEPVDERDLEASMVFNALMGGLDPTTMAQLLEEVFMAEQGDGGPYDLTSMSHDEAIASFALMYLYLTATDVGKGAHIPTWKASATIAECDLDALRRKGFVGSLDEDGKMVVSEEGMVHAEHLFDGLGLSQLL